MDFMVPRTANGTVANGTDHEDHDHDDDHDHEHGGSGAIRVGATFSSAIAFFAMLFIWWISYDVSLKETTKVWF